MRPNYCHTQSYVCHSEQSEESHLSNKPIPLAQNAKAKPRNSPNPGAVPNPPPHRIRRLPGTRPTPQSRANPRHPKQPPAIPSKAKNPTQSRQTIPFPQKPPTPQPHAPETPTP